MRLLTIQCLSLPVFLAALAPAQDVQRVPNSRRASNWLEAQDENHDGKIARSEATGALKTNFRRNDTDRDGFLDRSELTALAERLARNANRRRPARRGAMTTEQLRRRVGEH